MPRDESFSLYGWWSFADQQECSSFRGVTPGAYFVLAQVRPRMGKRTRRGSP